MLDDYETYPYLKIRVCLDGSIKAYLGTADVDWDLTRQIDEKHGTPDDAWIEIPQINTDQFRHIDLWVRFDSINALSYYLMTKYEDNIFDIGPKEIKGGLENRPYTSETLILPVADELLADGIAAIMDNESTTLNNWYDKTDFVALADGITSFG